jgi:hypothetical protein
MRSSEKDVAVDARRSELDLDCLAMELRQNGVGGRLYRGPGRIYQGSDGNLQFRLYATAGDEGAGSVTEHFRLQASGGAAKPSPVRELALIPAGQLIEDAYYYTLTARDLFGREWVAEGILPNLSHSHRAHEKVVLHGRLWSMKAEVPASPLDPGWHRLDLVLYERVKLPANASSQVHRSIAGLSRSLLDSYDVVEVNAAGFDFLIYQEGAVCLIEVYRQGPLPDHLRPRVIESLLFALGREFWWRESYWTQGDSATLELRSPRSHPVELVLRPPFHLNVDFPKSATHPVWELFRRYFEHVIGDATFGYHPITCRLKLAHEASASPADAEALAVCVAVEGLCEDLRQSGRISPPQDWEAFAQAVKELEQYIRSAPQVAAWEKAGLAKSRVFGLAKPLLKPSTAGLLRELARQGRVSGEYVESWANVRPKRAHGARTDEEFQVKLWELARLRQLLYQIIFDAIGYRGPYTDFSREHYPPADYPPAVPE